MDNKSEREEIAEILEKEKMERRCSGNSVKLKRELGLFSAINLILGVMIGSGIFVSPSSALEYSGSIGLALIIWTVSGVISLLGGCRYLRYLFLPFFKYVIILLICTHYTPLEHTLFYFIQ